MPIIGPSRGAGSPGAGDPPADHPPLVTVALPVEQAHERLGDAWRSITAQTLRHLEILVVLNGASPATAHTVRALAAGEPRARVIELPEANLAAALNVALEAARAPLVARMDGDDSCHPQRVERQHDFMRRRPEIAALGCAWEIIAPGGRVLGTVRPACDPAELRWRLLLGNPLAHGSMMLRRDRVLAAGGYDTRCTRAQDYELWLRLAERQQVAALPDVLYQHRTRRPDEHEGSTPQQAAVAAAAMLRAWAGLPRASDPARERLEEAVARLLERGAGAREAGAVTGLASADGPTVESLIAWLWTQWARPPAPRRAIDACRRSRLREVGAALRAGGVPRVWLWGAGDHTRWLLGRAADLGLEIAGIVDDSHSGADRFGLTIAPPDALAPGDTALLSSDWHEDALWDASAAARARGVRVVRLYGDAADERR